MLRQPVECRTCGEVLALQGIALFPLWHSGFLVLKLMSQDPVSPGSRSEATERPAGSRVEVPRVRKGRIKFALPHIGILHSVSPGWPGPIAFW